MKINKLFSLITIILIISSCDPNKEEIRLKRERINDSISNQRMNDSINEQAIKFALHLDMIEVGKTIKIKNLQYEIANYRKQLLNENENLLKIKKFSLGRTNSTKRQQIRKQKTIIKNLELIINSIDQEISISGLHKSFDFQKNPEDVIQHIFKAAKESNYSIMRYMLDPYGEYNSKAKNLCLIDMMPNYIKNQWNKTFSNGRIIGHKTIKNNRVRIEIATGVDSDKLISIELVQRMNNWYIINL